MILTKNLRVDFLGEIPRIKGEEIDPEDIIAFSALLTFSGKPIRTIYQNILDKEENVKEKVRKVLSKSSLRGHASIATTPLLAISFQGSKFLDSMLTGHVFSSSLMASGRRTKTITADTVYPTGIYQNKTALKIYREQSFENINIFNQLLEKGILQDEASKILHYGMIGTGIIILPIEAIIGFERELEEEGEWLPEDGNLFLKAIKKKLAEFGLEELYYTAYVSPRNIYPYPNIFKDPKKSNLARDLGGKQLKDNYSAIVDFRTQITPGFLERLRKFNKEQEKAYSSFEKIKRNWTDIVNKRKSLIRDYEGTVDLSIVSSVSWRVWGEKKRHRTVPQVVDSIYFSCQQALRALVKIDLSKITDTQIKQIDRFFAVPPSIAKNKEQALLYLRAAKNSLMTYQKLLKLGIKEKDAIYIIPRAIRIFVFQKFNLYNLIAGYYPLRFCSTAEEQMQAMSEKEGKKLREILKKKKLPEIAYHLVPKCHLVGFCPEENFCGKILTRVPFYNRDFHLKMKEELERKLKFFTKKKEAKNAQKNLPA